MNTAVAITVIVAALMLATSIVTAIRDTIQIKHKAARIYPHRDGGFTALGPEIFTDQAGDVICWKGVNYARQEQERP